MRDSLTTYVPLTTYDSLTTRDPLITYDPLTTSVFFVNDDENDDENDENILSYRRRD